MISQEDSERIEEAKSCEDCLGWHHHCKAECCKIIFLNNVNPVDVESNVGFLRIKVGRLSFSDQYYYRLHGATYTRGFLRFSKKDIIVVGRKVMYVKACSLLDEYLCKNHPDKKPMMCELLNLATAHLPNKPFEVTDNCLFRYKGREVKNEKKENLN